MSIKELNMQMKSALFGAVAMLAIAPMAFGAAHEGDRGRDGEVRIIYWQAP